MVVLVKSLSAPPWLVWIVTVAVFCARAVAANAPAANRILESMLLISECMCSSGGVWQLLNGIRRLLFFGGFCVVHVSRRCRAVGM